MSAFRGFVGASLLGLRPGQAGCLEACVRGEIEGCILSENEARRAESLGSARDEFRRRTLFEMSLPPQHPERERGPQGRVKSKDDRLGQVEVDRAMTASRMGCRRVIRRSPSGSPGLRMLHGGHRGRRSSKPSPVRGLRSSTFGGNL
jgi:hypothetical protein